MQVAPIALTMGEPAGIASELSLKAWLSRTETPPFFVIDDPKHLNIIARKLGLNVPIREIKTPGEASAVFSEALPVIREEIKSEVIPGKPNQDNAPAIINSITRAVSYSLNGEAAGIVTNPVHKSYLYKANFQYPGQTEFLATLVPGKKTLKPVMMLSCESLRVVPVTIHIPISQVSNSLNSDSIIETCQITEKGLRTDFGIVKPKLSVAALNPHAGESQTMGIEEKTIIYPAIKKLQDSGINISGPFPADTLFHKDRRTQYDVIICMYHDQALIPLKTIDFMGGINTTLGLPFIRTSPDHGSALDISGKGLGNVGSLLSALNQVVLIASSRNKLK